MAFNTCVFYYDGVSSEEYGLYYYEIGNNTQNAGSINNGFSVVSDTVSRRYQPIHYGVQKSDHMEFDMVFGSLKFLSRREIEEIAKWLTGRSTFAPLVIDDEDMAGVQYKAIITSMDQIQYDGLTIAFKAHVVCDSPFAYTESIHIAHQCDGEYSFHFTNLSNLPEMYAPDVMIELKSGEDFKMENKTTGEVVSFEFGGANTSDIQLYIFGKTKVLKYTSEDETLVLNLYDYMKLNGEKHFIFPRFFMGDNLVTVTGKCVVHITSEFPLQLGY